ncbi:MAG: hypothetical protein M3390_09450 [Chloroflexota bacterium]|nr:hypothetical protein [Chloroflexota bacterium]
MAASLAQTPTPASRTVLLTDPVPDPRQPGVLWFAPTGHTLRGNFLDYWNKNGGLPQFGYPITEEFTEPIGPEGAPIMVQYFERARFEHHPENAGTPHEVLLGALGREFHPQDPPAEPLIGPAIFPPVLIYFNETGHNLGGTFLRYWNQHGGLAIHGYPISEEFEEKSPIDGKTYKVQYFERSRFELHPENAGSPYEVLLGPLGTQLSRRNGYPYDRYPPYGHAADWSWVAGQFRPPFLMCAGCLCDSVRYEQNPGRALGPVGPVWEKAREDPLMAEPNSRMVRPWSTVVLFGRKLAPDDPAADDCFSGSYFVADWKPNPLR